MNAKSSPEPLKMIYNDRHRVATEGMADTILAALSDDQILLSNSLATVATRCVVIRDSAGKSQSVVSLSCVYGVSTIRVSYPGLVVIALASWLIAAGAHFSKEGGSSDVPIALVGLLFLAGYFGSRRAAIAFQLEGETVQTILGARSEAAALTRAVNAARAELQNQADEPSILAS